MANWYETFGGAFFLSIATLFCGGFGVMARYCFKSKCHRVNLCGGLINIERNVLAENEEEKFEIEHTRKSSVV